MVAFPCYPGEGVPLDFVYPIDMSAWTFVAGLYTQQKVKLYDVAITVVDPYTRRAHVAKDHTKDRMNQRLILRVDATDPNNPQNPAVEEAMLIVGAV